MTTSDPAAAAAITRTADWSPPGPGTWIADRSHGHPGATRLFRRLASELTATAYWDAFREFGSPAATIDMQFVNGQLYRRIVPLIGAKHERATPPPSAVVKILTRIHPTFRREERQAAITLEAKPYLDAIKDWDDNERDQWLAENQRHQQVDPATLDDAGLAAHIDDLNDMLERGWYRHHRLHAYDLGPIGDLMAHAQRWNLDTVETMRLLRGASPATVEAAGHARSIADALRDGGVDPSTVSTLDEIRSVPAGAAALDAYLDTFGWRLAGGYDIDAPVLHELPAAVCGTVRAAATAGPDTVDEQATHVRLRGQCPDPELFDQLVADARAAYGLRDDNGPLTSQWPSGLMRRAFLDAAERLHASGRLHEPAHVFELDAPELSAMLCSADRGPSADELKARAAERRWEREQRGPDHLGNPPVEPDLEPLPPALRRIMELIAAAASLLEPDDQPRGELAGLGIGTAPYRGRACVAVDAADAIERLEPGDVLVTPFTSPSFNSVLPMAGGLVIQEGGLLSHAAVMARELELPAIIGCRAAMRDIPDGAMVDVDPVAGEVRLA